MLFLLSLPGSSQVNVSHFIRQGRIALYNNQYVEAIENFNVAIEYKKDPFEEYFYRGIAKYNLGDYRGAAYDFTRTLEIHPFYSRAYHYRGVTYSAIMEKGKAIDDLNKAMEFDPYNAEVLISRGAVFLRMGKLKKALLDFDEALLIDSNIPEAYLNRAITHRELKQYIKALEDCNKAIEKNVFYKAAFAERGLIWYEMGQYEKALTDFNQAIKIDEGNPRYYYFRAITLYQMGDIEGTLENYDKVLALDPANALTYYNRAIIFSQVKEYQKALRDLDHVASLNPNNMLTYFNRAHLHYEMENYQQAIDDYSRVIQLFPKSARAYVMRAQAKAKTGNRQGARADRQYANQLLAAHDQHLQQKNNGAWIDSTYFSKIIEFEADFRSAESLAGGDMPGQRQISPRNPFRFTLLNSGEPAKGRSNAFVSDFNQENEHALKIILSNEPLSMTTAALQKLEKQIDSLITFSSPSARLYLLKGIIHHELQNLTTAVSNYNMAITTDPDFYPAYMNNALAVFEMKENSFNQDPELQNISLGRQQTPMKKSKVKDFEPVLNDLRKAINIRETVPELWFNHGNTMLSMKQYAGAVQSYTMAIDHDKDFADAYYNRGLTLIYLQDSRRGCTDMSKAGELGVKSAYEVIRKYCNND